MSTVLSVKAREKMELHLDDLIEKAEKLVNSTNVFQELDQSQIRNLSNMASSTDSFKVVELFIQYQMGREKGWRHGEFGRKLIEELHKLDALAEQIGKETKEEQSRIKMGLVRLFTGYLTRYFSYRKREEEMRKGVEA